jgi:hypothetical protein
MCRAIKRGLRALRIFDVCVGHVFNSHPLKAGGGEHKRVLLAYAPFKIVPLENKPKHGIGGSTGASSDPSTTSRKICMEKGSTLAWGNYM